MKDAADVGDRDDSDQSAVLNDETAVDLSPRQLVQSVFGAVFAVQHRYLIAPEHAVPDEPAVPIATRGVGNRVEGKQPENIAAGNDGIGAVLRPTGERVHEMAQRLVRRGGHRIARHPVSYTHLRAHETVLDLVCRLL